MDFETLKWYGKLFQIVPNYNINFHKKLALSQLFQHKWAK